MYNYLYMSTSFFLYTYIYIYMFNGFISGVVGLVMCGLEMPGACVWFLGTEAAAPLPVALGVALSHHALQVVSVSNRIRRPLAKVINRPPICSTPVISTMASGTNLGILFGPTSTPCIFQCGTAPTCIRTSKKSSTTLLVLTISCT